MIEEYKDVVKLHRDNGYYINVQGLKDKKGCSIEYPSNYLMESPIIGINYKYLLVNDGLEIYSYKNSEPLNQIEYPCPDYAKRVIILGDVSLKCIALNINLMLLKIYDENKKELPFVDFLSIFKKPKDSKREKIFREYCTNYLMNIDADIEGVDGEMEKLMTDLIDRGGF
jgi:hypothetical protein